MRLKAVLIAGLISSPLLLADDTDIYYTSFSGNPKPLVMLTLDLRSSLGSAIGDCSGKLVLDDCQDFLGDELYYNLDFLDYTVIGDANNPQVRPDGIPDATNLSLDPVNPDWAALRAVWADNNVDSALLFDVLRAAFQVIINSDQVIESGVMLGMMVPHEDTCTGNPDAGPGKIPNGNSAGCSNGAYVLKGFFDAADADERADFFRRLAAVPTPTVTLTDGNNSFEHKYQLNELYFEFYRYITGQDVFNGWLGYDDYASGGGGDSTTTLTDWYGVGLDYYPDPLDDPNGPGTYYVAPDPNTIQLVSGAGDDNYGSSEENANYLSPFETGAPDDWACSALYMINTVFGVAQQDDDSDFAIDDPIADGGLALSNPDNNEMISELYRQDLASSTYGIEIEGDQNLTSFFLSKTTNNTQDGWAESGGTDYALSLGDGAEIRETLERVFESIISESSTLVAASVPVNVLNRAESLDNVYLAIFQAESGSRWPGNIKKLKVGFREVRDVQNRLIGRAPQIQDFNDTPAFDQIDGRIRHDALTFWTDPLGEDVTPSGCVDGEAPLAEEEICGRDGRSVTRGGAGQQVSGFNSNDSDRAYPIGPGELNSEQFARVLYTENPTAALQLMPFNADTTTAGVLAEYLAPDPTDTDTSLKLIKWARGAVEMTGTLTEQDRVRWMVGDILHSRPLPLNYGARGNYDPNEPDIRLFFGSNDGWFRMVRNTDGSGNESGQEVWGFMPLEVMGIQHDLATDNLPDSRHPYGVDGVVTSLIIDKNSNGIVENGNNGSRAIDVDTGEIGSGDKAFVYFGLRRGGKAYYAFDVSNPDAPPELMWKISNQQSDFSELGMTFSSPRVAYVNYSGTRAPALIFGGGYNGGWKNNPGVDEDPRIGKDQSGSGTPDDVGNAIYVVDAVTGQLIWKATDDSGTNVYQQDGMVHSIPSDMALLDSNQNGTVDMAFVGDTGGNVWRVDLPEAVGAVTDSRASWSATKLAELGGSGVDDRRFFHPPDIVLGRDQVNLGTEDQPTLEERNLIGVVITSGDRAHPTETSVDNFVYFIKDRNITSGEPYDSNGDPRTPFKHVQGEATSLIDVSSNCVDTPCSVGQLENGWRLELGQLGEKGLSKPITIRGTVFFTTYLPEGEADQGLCAPGLGTGRLYGVNIIDGTPNLPVTELDTPGIPPPELPPITTEEYDGSSIPPDPNSPFDPNGPPEYPGCETSLLLPGGEFYSVSGRCKWRAYWYEQGVDDI